MQSFHNFLPLVKVSITFLTLHVIYCVVQLFQALKSVVLYVILAPFDNEQSDLVHRISGDKKLEEIPKYK